MTTASMASLGFYYSGGSGNSTPASSTGGAKSATLIPLQTLTSTGLITGVTLNEGYANAIGAGTLTYTFSTNTFTWAPYGGTSGLGVQTLTSGRYFVQGANNAGGLSIEIDFASLPSSTTTDTVTAANQTEKWFANQTKEESTAGVNKYHCFVIRNDHATDPIVDTRIFISENTPGADTWAIALDPIVAGSGAVGPTDTGNELTPGAGLTFVAPSSYNHADFLPVGQLLAGECRFFWAKQITPPNIAASYAANTFKLGLYGKF